MEYNLEKRTLKFSKDVINVCRKLKHNYLNINTISQLIRSATSVGANYCEANGVSSKNDFRNKIFICKKEIQETKYWIGLLITAQSEYNKDIEDIRKEAHKLSLIFGKIASTLKK